MREYKDFYRKCGYYFYGFNLTEWMLFKELNPESCEILILDWYVFREHERLLDL